MGDYVHEVSGQKFENEDAFLRLLNTAHGPLELTLERNGRLHTLRLDVPPAPASAETQATPATSEPVLPLNR